MGGAGNIDDNVLELPGGAYRAISLRAYDPARPVGDLVARRPEPGQLDPPVVGGFADGVGTFIAEDTFDGRPILVRFVWSDITADAAAGSRRSRRTAARPGR